jgi:tetratricopeptide (TPR) repeat protein
VQAVLGARIDRLPAEEKRLLQTAAVIGTEVPLPLLQGITELPEAALYRGLAHHALRGGVWNKTLAYCRQAGEKAIARSATREAVGYFEQALSVLPHLPEARHTLEQAVDVRFALRSALFASGDSGRVLLYLQEAEALATTLDDPRRLGHISGYLSAHFRNMGAYDRAIAAAQRALALASAAEDSTVHALAKLYLGTAYWAQGDYRQAIDCLKQTVTSLQGAQRRERLGQTSVPSVQALAFLAASHAEQGLFAEGIALGEEGMQIAEAIAQPSSRVWASYGIGLLALRRGDLPKALSALEQAIGVCREADLPVFVPRVAAALGAAYTLSGRMADAVTLLTPAVERTTAADMTGFQALCCLPLAEAHLLADRFEEAYALAQRAFAQAGISA